MAPSNVFSYLRPHHKRNGSNPTSPEPPISSHSSNAPWSINDPDIYNSFPRIRDASNTPSESPISPIPPSLPPIPRIASRIEHSHPISTKLAIPSSQWDYSRDGEISNELRDSQSVVSPALLSPIPPPKDSIYTEPMKRPHDAEPTGYRTRGQRVNNMNTIPLQSMESLSTVTGFSSSTTSLPTTSSFQGGYALNDKRPNATRAAQSYSIPSAQKSGKTKLNLLNPMSLLMRRRNAHALENLSEESLVSHRNVPAMSLPDDYDPRIRGNVIHDFSAPRPKRNISFGEGDGRSRYSSGRTPNMEEFQRSSSNIDTLDVNCKEKDESPIKIEREHTPIFKENFDHNLGAGETDAAIRAESLANKAFLAKVSLPPPDHSPPPIPALSKNRPLNARMSDPETIHSAPLPPLPNESQLGTQESSQLSPISENDPTPQSSVRKSRASQRSTKTLSRATSGAEWHPAGLPSHLTSKASRFSFQIHGGDSSAQEKLLEERHKQKAAAKAAAATRQSIASLPVEEDEFDEDALYDMDEGGFEGGFDDDDYGADFDDGMHDNSINASTFDDGIRNNSINASTFDDGIPKSNIHDSTFDDGIPKDSIHGTVFENETSDDVITDQPFNNGFAHSTISNSTFEDYGSSHNPESDMSGFNFSMDRTPYVNPLSPIVDSIQTPRDAFGNRIGYAMSNSNPQSPVYDSNVENDTTSPQGLGLSGLTMNSASTEGLSVLPLRFSRQELKQTPDSVTEDILADDDMYFDDGMIEDVNQDYGDHFDESQFDDPSNPLYERPTPVPRDPSSNAQEGNHLEQDNTGDSDSNQVVVAHGPSEGGFNNLEAYHGALADAANKAAADGRFRRHDSISTSIYSTHEDEMDNDGSPSMDSGPSQLPNSTRATSFSPTAFKMVDFADDYGYDDFDALEDDPIIAAANAEALANDDDGFYGQEFGFYASAGQNSEAQFANGGYFGPRGGDLGRSVSGRNAVREPNLTPITERSEYSTRNSYISLHHFGGNNGALPSPGLAQLARMSPYGFDDDDMSLSQLMKLRRGAFGGSNGSLRSAASSPRNSSPIANPQYAARGSSPITRTEYMPQQDATPISRTDSRTGSSFLDEVAEEVDDDDFTTHGVEGRDYISHNSSSRSSSSPPGSPTLGPNDFSFPPSNEATPRPPPRRAFLPHHPLPLQTQNLGLAGEQQEDTDASPVMPPQKLGHIPLAQLTPVSPTRPQGWRTHSRTGSDSVTYVKEQDERGMNRWVLERRRTAETGELELIGREIVEGGRI
ncbi:hypothetical protein M501DRAFT_384058 [Patellaria atrata CBS 101060]|uniref:AGC-kinase C-terminal domain-containing protein n=1 Tax=Patellaria atrata CBS 101060 TaxID=1346257 RepID=A0A9P4SFS0_9PEZI|nr:hypothetical protein M501DRAFT_384058 [Patellaria atrata CBS 101060]